MDNKILSPKEWYSKKCLNGYPTTDVLLNSKGVQEYVDYVLSQQPKKDINLPLPEFLYEDCGQVRIGRHGDSSVTDEWNAYVNEVKRLNGIQ